MQKEMLINYLELIIGNLVNETENIREYNKSFYHYEMLKNQTDRLLTTSLLLGDLLDELKKTSSLN
ncbi:hypothetical protein [uncultured Fructobacillus sp.]|uniref:hypothetical protein n=1 Tax=uncultured Fructobacillus sp. TaxID=591942 RepID=UPI00259873D2|nr:hypothetical protein [uncultured Fructobacillus sp.]